jgi:hypothetical protein
MVSQYTVAFNHPYKPWLEEKLCCQFLTTQHVTKSSFILTLQTEGVKVSLLLLLLLWG